MLDAEQSAVVRAQIARVLDVDPSRVVSAARLFADLGGTAEHLKPLRLAIESALGAQIQPIVNAVNARTAIDESGRLTKASLAQIVDYLGEWPERSHGPVAFPDLFTVGMIEAIVAKALEAPHDGAKAESDQPLQLPPAMQERVRALIGEIYQLPVESVTSDLCLSANEEDRIVEFASVFLKVGETLGINLDAELKQMQRWLEEYSSGTATPLTVRGLRRLIPDIETLTDDDSDPTATVATVERLCAAAIERRESPEEAQARAPRESLGLYASRWKWDVQDWWASLPAALGPARYRLYVTGMLRAAYVSTGSLDAQIAEILAIVEKYAETGMNADALARKHRAVSKWKWWRNPLWSGLLCILKPECTAEDGAGILGRLGAALEWSEAQVLSAARQWLKSIVPPTDAIAIEPAWCTPEVLDLAGRMNDLRTYLEFPKLGDLLEHADCRNPTILAHCRDFETRHLRGDWLIDALLAVPVEKPKKGSKKSSGATAKVKKPKPPTMTSRQKKTFKELLMQYQGGVPVSAAWASVWQSDHSRHAVSFREKDASLSREALEVLCGIYPARMVVHPNVAVVRRQKLSAPADLHQALVLNARAALLIWHTSPYPHDLSDMVRDAFAAADDASLQWALRELPYRSVMDRDAQHWSYLAMRAIIARDEEQVSRLIENWPHPAGSDRVFLLERGLLPILKNDRAAVVAALNDILESEREADDPECFGAFSLAAHACYEAARYRDANLVADFDTQQGYPWDAEFHAAAREAPQPLEGLDFSTTPEFLREILMRQTIPEWLKKFQNCPRNQDKTVALVLNEIGPEPDKVYRQVSGLLGHWTREDFDHRTARLPVTLLTSISPESAPFVCKPLTNAGATVEIVTQNAAGKHP